MTARTHGMSRTPLYCIWTTMVQRCHNPNAQKWKYYGGRGITVCDRWRDSFEAFMADVPPRPSAAHSLDREDNSRGYEPGNVRWVRQVAQTRNSRRAKLTLAQAEEIRRLHAAGGWSCVALGRRYGVGHSTIGYILQSKTWKPGEPLQ